MKIKCKHILLSHMEAEPFTNLQTAYQALLEAERLQALIEDGDARFEDIAYEHSACASGQSGGDLGWINEFEVDQAFSQAVKKIKIGEMGPPFYSSAGVHIVWRTG